MATAQRDIALILTFSDNGTPVVKKVVNVVKNELADLGKTAADTGKKVDEGGVPVRNSIPLFERFGNTVGGAFSKLSDAGNKMSNVGRQMAFTVAALGGGIVMSVRHMINMGDEMHDLAMKTGISTEVLSSFKLSAEKSGTGISGIAMALRFLSRNMASADQGTKGAVKTFKDLGIEIHTTDGKLKSSSDVLLDVAEKFANMKDGAEKTALSMKVFSRFGMELIPMLNLGKKGLQEDAEMAKKLGMIMSGELATACDELNDQMVELKGAFNGIYMSIARDAVPIAREYIDKIIKIVVRTKELIDNSPKLISSLASTGTKLVMLAAVMTPLLMVGGKVIAMFSSLATYLVAHPWLVVAMAVGVVIKQIDDLVQNHLKNLEEELDRMEKNNSARIFFNAITESAKMSKVEIAKLATSYKNDYASLLTGLSMGEAGPKLKAEWEKLNASSKSALSKLLPEFVQFRMRIIETAKASGLSLGEISKWFNFYTDKYGASAQKMVESAIAAGQLGPKFLSLWNSPLKGIADDADSAGTAVETLAEKLGMVTKAAQNKQIVEAIALLAQYKASHTMTAASVKTLEEHIKKLQDDLRGFNADAKGTTVEIEDMGKASEGTGLSLEALYGPLSAIIGTVQAMPAGESGLAGALKAFGLSADNVGLKLGGLLDAWDRLNKGGASKQQLAEAASVLIKAYQEAGIKVPASLQTIADSSASAAAKVKSSWLDAFGIIGAVLKGFSDDFTGALSTLISSVASAVTALGSAAKAKGGLSKMTGADYATALTPMAGDIGGSIGELIGGNKKGSYKGTGAALGSALGAINPVLGLVGGAVGGLIGGLFGKKEAKTEEQRIAEQQKKQMKEATDAMSKYGKISDATAQAIMEDRKSMSGAAAEAKNFASVIKDVGVNQKNVNDLWKGALGALDQYAQGGLTAEQATKSLGDSFTELVAGAQNLGTEGSKAMTDFIAQTQASGLKVKEVTDYINNQLGVVKKGSMSAADGLALMANAPNQTKESMGRLERQAMATFEAMKKNGASTSEAIDSLGPSLDIMAAQYKKMGIEGGAGIKELLAIRSVTAANQELFAAVSGNLGVLNALANTGSMTQQTFTDSATQASAYFTQLQAAGLTGNQALSEMAPTLERLRFLAREHGLSIDATTQSLITQAEQQGLLKDEELSANETMMAGFGEIIKALGGDVPAAMQKAMDKMRELGTTGADAGASMTSAAAEADAAMNGLGMSSEAVVNTMRAKFPEGVQAIQDMMDAGINTKGAMQELEHSIYGSGVVGALEILKSRVPSTFAEMIKNGKDSIASMGSLEGSITSVGGIVSIAKESFSSLGEVGSTAIEGIAGSFSTIEGNVVSAQGKIRGMKELISSMDGATLNVGVADSPDSATISASGGGEWFVGAAAQKFIAHKGETVKIGDGAGGNPAVEDLLRTLIATVEKTGNGEVAVIKLPGDNETILKVKKMYDSGNWKIPMKSVEGS